MYFLNIRATYAEPLLNKYCSNEIPVLPLKFYETHSQ